MLSMLTGMSEMQPYSTSSAVFFRLEFRSVIKKLTALNDSGKS